MRPHAAGEGADQALGWIYDGKVTNLPPHLRAKIRELQT